MKFMPSLDFVSTFAGTSLLVSSLLGTSSGTLLETGFLTVVFGGTTFLTSFSLIAINLLVGKIPMSEAILSDGKIISLEDSIFIPSKSEVHSWPPTSMTTMFPF